MRSFQRLYKEMQLGERADLTARVIAAVASALGSFRRRLPAQEIMPAEFLSALLPGHFETMAEFLAEHAARTAPWKHWPPELIPEDVVEAADAAALQRFSFLGLDFHFRDAVDWHHSLGPGGPWPRAHWSEIPFRNIRHLGDIKPCWEMNRHQFFVTLALAHVKTGDPKYAATLVKFINSWCDQNTPEMGVNYISSLDIGIRCIAWIFADRLLTGVTAYDDGTRSRLHCNLLSQARHIADYLGYAERAGGNNNLLGEAAALAFIALNYPEFQASEKWLHRALGVLWPALDSQVGPDGAHFEASPGYQQQVMEFLLLVFAELRRQKKPVPSKAYEILEKMGTALRVTRQPDGAAPPLNDNDEGFVVPLPLQPAARVGGILAVLAAFYDRPDFKASAAHSFGPYGHLLLGEAGEEEFRMISEVPDEMPFTADLREGGLHVIRRRGDYLLLKNNRDPFPRSGHNHADLLGLLLFLGGKQVLVDAGTFRFSDEGGIRNALRGTAAHNTLTVDLKNQAEPLRNFDWASTVKPGFTHLQEEEDFALIDAQHDSYHETGVTHRRVALWLRAEETLLVVDQLQGRDSHSFEQYWHFPPGTRVEEKASWFFRLSDAQGPLAFLRLLRAKDLDRHEILAGTEDNPSMLHSPRYGTVLPGIALKHSWMSTLGPQNSSHRITVFTKTEQPCDYSDAGYNAFIFNGWQVDIAQAPAKVTRVKK